MTVIEVSGSGEESYVFVHGMPSDRRVWDELAALAPPNVNVVLVDLPDHGEAPNEPTATVEPLEQAIFEAVDAAPGRVTLVGHSFGAWLVAATSSRMPERVGRFVAICGMSHYDDEAFETRRAIVAALENHQVEPSAVRDSILALFFGDECTPALEARVAAMLDLSREHWMRLGRRALAIHQRPPAYFERPALVVHATGDQGISLEHGRVLAERSRCPLVTIDTTSHMVQITHARELAEIIYQRS